MEAEMPSFSYFLVNSWAQEGVSALQQKQFEHFLHMDKEGEHRDGKIY
jgi:hypothetical protein